jgi:serine/threonine protein phosphatase PrpC
MDEFTDIFRKTNFKNFKKLDLENLCKLFLEKTSIRFKSHISRIPKLKDMSTTFNASIISKDNKIYTINIGDSRTYFISEKKIELITTDHNVYNHLKETKANKET